ncbi:MAG: ATP-binding protein, partial [Ferrimicrobium acidiphilum]
MTEATGNPVAEEITEMAKRLRLPHLRRNFFDLALTAKAQRWDPIELIRVLLETEITGRNAATLSLRRSAANLPGSRTLAGFDHSVSSIPTHVVNALATMEWVRRKENLVLCGPPGTGKSFLAEALASEGI